MILPLVWQRYGAYVINWDEFRIITYGMSSLKPRDVKFFGAFSPGSFPPNLFALRRSSVKTRRREARETWNFFWRLLTRLGVSNGLREHLRACKQFVYFFEHKQWIIFSCEQRVLQNYKWRVANTSEIFRQLESLFFFYFAPSNQGDSFKTGQQAQSCATW